MGTSALAPKNAAGQHQGRCDIGQRPGQRNRKLSTALVGNLLAFRVRIGEKPADGKQQHRAQFQSQPGRNQQPRGFAHCNRSHKNQEQRKSALPSVAGADAEAYQQEHGKEDVDAHLHAHPTPQRN